MKAIRQVAVIGAGLMGHGIAQVFAVGGYPVTLVDIEDEPLSRAVEMVRSNSPSWLRRDWSRRMP